MHKTFHQIKRLAISKSGLKDFRLKKVSADKLILKNEIEKCINYLKKYFMNIVIVSQKPIQTLNLIYLLGGIDVFPSAIVIVKQVKTI